MSLAGKHIWICPLNWGLGHASRCIPVIRALQTAGANIYLASNGDAAALLKKEFPKLPLFNLPDYQIKYGRRSAVGGLIWRLPAIFKAIRKEQKVLAELLSQHPCDLIISDNRYGAWSASQPSVLITHQLNLPIQQQAKGISRQIFKYWFSKFNEIWVPDWEDNASLAGNLSHGNYESDIRHLGIISRMKPQSSIGDLDILVVLSGPEPQRTQLESRLLTQLQNWPGRCCLIRGTQTLPDLQDIPEGLTVIDMAKTTELEKLMSQSKLIICRTGYSSLMDLVQLGKSALVIPTPGQPEQEYLAEFHGNKNWWMVQSQADLNVAAAWKNRSNLKPPKDRKMKIENWLKACERMITC